MKPTVNILIEKTLRIHKINISENLHSFLWRNATIITDDFEGCTARIMNTTLLQNIEYPSIIEEEFKKLLPDETLNEYDNIILTI